MNIVDSINMVREGIREADIQTMALKENEALKIKPLDDHGEIVANIILAHRHLEDARMRLGKAIQAYEGRDIFDVPQVAAAIEETRKPKA